MILKTLGVVCCIIVALYLLALIYTSTQQEKILFHPNTTDAGTYKEFELPWGKYGDEIVGGLTNWSPACTGKVIVYLHGNAGNVYTQSKQ